MWVYRMLLRLKLWFTAVVKKTSQEINSKRHFGQLVELNGRVSTEKFFIASKTRV